MTSLPAGSQSQSPGPRSPHPTPLRIQLHDAIGALWDWFFPPACMSCHVPLDPARGDFLCLECRKEIRIVRLAPCPRCQPWDCPPEGASICETCRHLPDTFASAASAFPYAGVVGGIIRNLKYRHAPHVADAVARLTVAALRPQTENLLQRHEDLLIVPVPMHFRRRVLRGANQAASIGEALGKLLGVQCDAWAARRMRATAPQARKKSPAERLRNVAGAFDVPEPDRVIGRAVLLVDDVMTTGATVASCAGALGAAGAAAVHILTVARAGSAFRLEEAPPEMTGAGGYAVGASRE